MRQPYRSTVGSARAKMRSPLVILRSVLCDEGPMHFGTIPAADSGKDGTGSPASTPSAPEVPRPSSAWAGVLMFIRHRHPAGLDQPLFLPTPPQLRLPRSARCSKAGDSGCVGTQSSRKLGHVPTVGELDPLSLPRPFLTLHHDSSQYPVDSRLVTRTFGLEPVNHFDIHAQRDPPLPWTVPARLCAPLPPPPKTTGRPQPTLAAR